MSRGWVKIDELMPVHPKVQGLSDQAFRLAICGLCWASLHRTDGEVKTSVLGTVSGLRYPKRYAAELVAAGLWETTADGWRIHDYLDWQASAKEIEQVRENAKARQRRWRNASTRPSRHASTGPSRHASTEASRNALVDGAIDVDKTLSGHRPSPTVTEGARAREGRDDDLDDFDPRDLELDHTAGVALAGRGFAASEAVTRIVWQSILKGRTVADRGRYVAAAIEGEPDPLARWGPATAAPVASADSPESAAARHPSSQKLNEALQRPVQCDAGGCQDRDVRVFDDGTFCRRHARMIGAKPAEPPGPDDDVAHQGAALARELLAQRQTAEPEPEAEGFDDPPF